MTWDTARLDDGISNLLQNCAECAPGSSILVVFETEADGYYGTETADAVASRAAHLGLSASSVGIPLHRAAAPELSLLHDEMAQADCTVFFARYGDQMRFQPLHQHAPRRVISYALDEDMLASPFGTLPYQGFARLEALINAAFAKAREIRVTCPRGTDFSGSIASAPEDAVKNVSIKRFPVSVFAPLDAAYFRGWVAQDGFLTGTGSRYYEPYSCPLDAPIYFAFDGNRIIDITGAKHNVAAARAHYNAVADQFGLDPFFIHSWHAGIHPGCRYDRPAGDSLERWSGSAFGNPRLLHFHTCGAEAPGEISLNVLDPTIALDGVPVWDAGFLRPERLQGGAALLSDFPDLAHIFAEPERAVGQSADGRLRFR